MGKSKDFILQRINDNCSAGIENTDISNAQEIDFTSVLSMISDYFRSLFKEDRFTYVIKDTDSGNQSNFEVIHNPDCNFEYFTMETCVCDGTLCFAAELLPKILEKIINLKTVNKESIPDDLSTNLFDYDVRYTVGNFVFNNEFGNFGTNEKPWMRSKFTMMLPIKSEFLIKS